MIEGQFTPLPYAKDIPAFYRELRGELSAIYQPQWFTNLASFSAMIMAHMPRLNWVGFYLLDTEGTLRLGPFQGLPACLSIPAGKGVCGKSVVEKATMNIGDVHAFPGHIACDARSRSELVVPLKWHGRVLGVLDIDSPEINRFSLLDQQEMEMLVTDLMSATQWPLTF